MKSQNLNRLANCLICSQYHEDDLVKVQNYFKCTSCESEYPIIKNIPIIISPKKLCCFGIYNSFILSNGTMLPCCIAAMSILSNNNYLKAISMGNVFTDGFMSVWHGEKAQKVRYSILAKGDDFAYCKKCTDDESGLFESFYRMSKLFYKK